MGCWLRWYKDLMKPLPPEVPGKTEFHVRQVLVVPREEPPKGEAREKSPTKLDDKED